MAPLDAIAPAHKGHRPVVSKITVAQGPQHTACWQGWNRTDRAASMHTTHSDEVAARDGEWSLAPADAPPPPLVPKAWHGRKEMKHDSTSSFTQRTTHYAQRTLPRCAQAQWASTYPTIAGRSLARRSRSLPQPHSKSSQLRTRVTQQHSLLNIFRAAAQTDLNQLLQRVFSSPGVAALCGHCALCHSTGEVVPNVQHAGGVSGGGCLYPRWKARGDLQRSMRHRITWRLHKHPTHGNINQQVTSSHPRPTNI
jgi:hypothetical protein